MDNLRLPMGTTMVLRARCTRLDIGPTTLAAGMQLRDTRLQDSRPAYHTVLDGSAAASVEIVLSRLQAREVPVAEDPAAIETPDEADLRILRRVASRIA